MGWHSGVIAARCSWQAFSSALERGGFDLGAFIKAGSKRWLLGPAVALARNGAIGAKIGASSDAHSIPADRAQPPLIVVRRDPS